MAKKVKVELVLSTVQTETSGRVYHSRGWDVVLAELGTDPSPLEQEMREAVVGAFPASHAAFIADMLVSDHVSKVELGGYNLSITPYAP